LAGLLAEPDVPIEWLIEGILEPTGRLILSGAPGSGKTWLLESLAIAVASGSPWLGHFAVKQGTVLLVDQENSLAVVRRRLRSLSADSAAPLYIASTRSLRVDDAGGFNTLRDL